jgi:membrane-bound lytic murein transglycosylase B
MRRGALTLLAVASAALACAAPATAASRLAGIPSPGGGLIQQPNVVSSAGGIGANGGTAPGSVAPVPTSTNGGIAPSGQPSTGEQSTYNGPTPGTGASDIPRAYMRLYRAAARAYGVDWRILAAIGKSESDHGRSTAAGVRSGRNFADCCSGPMQICTVVSCGRVWQQYAVDGDGDGIESVYDPADAIPAAGAILRDLQRTFGRHPKLLLAAYNAGVAPVIRYKGVPPYPETQAYVAAGIRYMKLIRRS